MGLCGIYNDMKIVFKGIKEKEKEKEEKASVVILHVKHLLCFFSFFFFGCARITDMDLRNAELAHLCGDSAIKAIRSKFLIESFLTKILLDPTEWLIESLN